MPLFHQVCVVVYASAIPFFSQLERYYFLIVAWAFPAVKNLSIQLTYNFTSDGTGNELSSEYQYEPYAQAARVLSYSVSALGMIAFFFLRLYAIVADW
jgi:hypothetical protein